MSMADDEEHWVMDTTEGLRPYKHVEGTHYDCPECWTYGGKKTRLFYHRNDMMICYDCQSKFTMEFLSNLKHLPRMVDKKLHDALELYLELAKNDQK